MNNETSMNGEVNYLSILKTVYLHGERKKNRTGIDTFAIPPVTLTHDMSEGFPLLTTKRVPFKLIASELQFFIQGLTDKNWLTEENNHIWDEWARPSAVKDAMRKDGIDPDQADSNAVKEYQKKVNDLGPIYGWQWRRFNHPVDESINIDRIADPNSSCDQLAKIVETLKVNPNDRRMVCTAWNPLQLNDQALPPCHLMWIVNHINGKLHLQWTQRSCDMFLGVPFNLASYALLLHLLCRESGMEPGTVSGTLVDCHIYENHMKQVEIQLDRTPTKLPTIETKSSKGIFDWNYTDTEVIGYEPQATIKGDVAV